MEQEAKGTSQRSGVDGDRLGPYRIGRSREMGPGLGRIYEVWSTLTGEASLVLVPGEQVNWQPTSSWKVRVSYDPAVRALVVEVLEAPTSFDFTELVNMLVMASAALERLENDPQVHAHLSLDLPRRNGREARHVLQPPPRAPRSRRWNPRHAAALVSLAAVVLAVGVWFSYALGHRTSAALASPALEQVETSPLGALAIQSSLPDKPFQGQATAPCREDSHEVEINGGCWLAADREPPCLQKVQVEYEAHCYVPVATDPPPPP